MRYSSADSYVGCFGQKGGPWRTWGRWRGIVPREAPVMMAVLPSRGRCIVSLYSDLTYGGAQSVFSCHRAVHSSTQMDLSIKSAWQACVGGGSSAQLIYDARLSFTSCPSIHAGGGPPSKALMHHHIYPPQMGRTPERLRVLLVPRHRTRRDGRQAVVGGSPVGGRGLADSPLCTPGWCSSRANGRTTWHPVPSSVFPCRVARDRGALAAEGFDQRISLLISSSTF